MNVQFLLRFLGIILRVLRLAVSICIMQCLHSKPVSTHSSDFCLDFVQEFGLSTAPLNAYYLRFLIVNFKCIDLSRYVIFINYQEFNFACSREVYNCDYLLPLSARCEWTFINMMIYMKGWLLDLCIHAAAA